MRVSKRTRLGEVGQGKESRIEASNLLELLRNCANASPNRTVPEEPVDCYFNNEMKRLKELQVWLQNERVRTWVALLL